MTEQDHKWTYMKAAGGKDFDRVNLDNPCPEGILERPEDFPIAQVALCYFSNIHANPEIAAKVTSPDITLYEPDGLPFSGTYRGIEAISKEFAALFYEQFDVQGFGPVGLYEGGNSVAIHMEFEAIAHATGREVHARLVELYYFKNGRVDSIWPYYFDTAAINAALGNPVTL